MTDRPARARGVIGLVEERCTVCMLCVRECPDWCIDIDSHVETLPPDEEHRRPRSVNVLDGFAIDYALCMYCGICVEVCPFDALHWAPTAAYAEPSTTALVHGRDRLAGWEADVVPQPALDDRAVVVDPGPRAR
ncbi:MAG: 4Fe-4S binding protein [Candidatus Nanopelagicales bacterium]